MEDHLSENALYGKGWIGGVQGDGSSAIWTPIGAAWPNKDGAGFNLSCDAVPLTGRIVMRTIVEREEGGGQQ